MALAAAATGALAGEPFSPPPALVDLASPAAPGAMAPNWATGDGALILSWLEPEGSGHRLRLARLGEGRFDPPSTVIAGPGLFANWADFPAVAAAADGTLYAHWLAKSGPETYAYAIEVARSTDGGRSWQRLGPLHADGTATEHGFVSWVAEGAGVRAFWLDGRATAEGGAMSLRTALVGERVGATDELDARVCDCCQTGAAVAAGGPLVVYRDRSPEEIRDIAVVRRAPTGGWAAPAAVAADGWKLPGCPVNGPAVAAEGNRVAVAWWTGVRPPGPRVRLALSTDGGASFGEPMLVDGDRPLGRVSLVLTPGGDAVVGWLALTGKEAELRLVRVSPAGQVGPPLAAARTSAARASGFPRLALRRDRLHLAWVEVGDEAAPSRLRAASLPLSALR